MDRTPHQPFSAAVSTPSDSCIYLGLQRPNCGSQCVLFGPHFIRTEKGSPPGQKAASSGRMRSPAGKRDPGYRDRLLCSSLSLRAGVLLVGFSRGKDACASLPLPFMVKAKLFQNPHLSRSHSTPLTELCYVAATQAEKARPSGSGGSPRGVAASASPLAQPPEMF